jgi:hypothetical protein
LRSLRHSTSISVNLRISQKYILGVSQLDVVCTPTRELIPGVLTCKTLPAAKDQLSRSRIYLRASQKLKYLTYYAIYSLLMSHKVAKSCPFESPRIGINDIYLDYLLYRRRFFIFGGCHSNQLQSWENVPLNFQIPGGSPCKAKISAAPLKIESVPLRGPCFPYSTVVPV